MVEKMEKYGLVNAAGASFAADVEAIVGKYRAEADELEAAKNASLAAAARIKADALSGFDAKYSKLRSQTVAQIRKAAEVRAPKSGHPEDLLAACEEYVKPIETNGGTIEAESIMKALQMSAEARQLRAEAERKAQRRIALKRRVVDSDWRRSTYRI